MLKIEWVEIPAGKSIVGLSNEQKESIYNEISKETKRARFRNRDEYDWCRQAERELELVPLQQLVELPTFYITKFPITQGQFREFSAYQAARARGVTKRFATDPRDLSKMPEEFLWRNAKAVAEQLGGRLPSKQEWEKAARGPEGWLYPWGNEWQPTFCNCGGQYKPEYSIKQGIWRSVVDAYPQGVSPYGVWDMVGNVSEYIADPGSSKGWSAKDMSNPQWFWSITPITGPGRNAGLRPVLDKWPQRQWPDFELVSTVDKDKKGEVNI